MLKKLITKRVLVPYLKLHSDALNPPISNVQLLATLLQVLLLMVIQRLCCSCPMSLASANDLTNTSIKTDYVLFKISKSKDFLVCLCHWFWNTTMSAIFPFQQRTMRKTCPHHNDNFRCIRHNVVDELPLIKKVVNDDWKVDNKLFKFLCFF